VDVECPYCGETVPVFVDTGGGASQRYIEDCSVCCRPMELSVLDDGSGGYTIVAQRADE